MARVLLAIAILLQTSEAAAALSYVVRRSGGTFSAQRGEFAVVADNGRIRADAVNPSSDTALLYDALLSIDSHVIALNSRLQTWYELARISGEPVKVLCAAGFEITTDPHIDWLRWRSRMSDA